MEKSGLDFVNLQSHFFVLPFKHKTKHRSILLGLSLLRKLLFPTASGQDIKLLGLSVVLFNRQNPEPTRFLSLPVFHFQGCQALVIWKQWQGRGGKHISLPMQILYSASDCSTFSKLWYIAEKNSYLGMQGFSLCTLLMSQLSGLELLHAVEFIDSCRVVRCCVYRQAHTHIKIQR